MLAVAGSRSRAVAHDFGAAAAVVRHVPQRDRIDASSPPMFRGNCRRRPGCRRMTCGQAQQAATCCPGRRWKRPPAAASAGRKRIGTGVRGRSGAPGRRRCRRRCRSRRSALRSRECAAHVAQSSRARRVVAVRDHAAAPSSAVTGRGAAESPAATASYIAVPPFGGDAPHARATAAGDRSSSPAAAPGGR